MQYPGYDATADIEVINSNTKKLVQNAEEQDEAIKSKEPIIIKKTGWNLDKSDLVENDGNKLLTPKGAFNLKNWLIDNYTALFNTRLAHGGYGGTAQTLFNLIEAAKNSLTSLINGKENSFEKNNAFNKDFGTLTGTVLEGAKLAETLGLEYGGIVNNNNAKVAGKAYYCTANKAIYKCIQNTSLNYIDANYFEGLSNDKLLGKLQNLYSIKEYNGDAYTGETLHVDGYWTHGSIVIQYVGTSGNQQTFYIVRGFENYTLYSSMGSNVVTRIQINTYVNGEISVKSNEKMVIIKAYLAYKLFP